MSKIKFYEDSAKTNQVYPELDPEEMAQKANIDGYYEEMTVGAADNLTGRGDGAPASFLYRTAGGNEDIADGIATIQSIKGNTISWNSLTNEQAYSVDKTEWMYTGTATKNGITKTYDANTHKFTFTGSNNSTSVIDFELYNFQVGSLRNGHKLLMLVNGLDADDSFYIWDSYGGAMGIAYARQDRIITLNSTTIYCRACLRINGNCTRDFTANPLVFNLQFFDLTQMFGAGNEPTIAEFKTMFPLEFYEYNKGTLLNFNGTGLQTIGFNQWDGEWESGGIDNETGEKEVYSGFVRSKNYIPVFPNTTYYRSATPSTGTRMFFYEEDKTYISNTTVEMAGGTFTTPTNAKYMLFKKYYDNLNGICINLSWSGYRNGEYEEYWEYTRELPVSQYFPEGLKSTPVAYDELTKDEAISRIGTMILDGSDDEGWIVNPNMAEGYYGYYINNIKTKYPDLEYNTDSAFKGRLFLNNYTYNTFSSTMPAYNVGLYNVQSSGINWIIFSGGTLSQFNTLEKFKSYLSVNPLVINYVKKADSITTTDIEVPLNLSYKVSDFGTERILPINTSTPTTNLFRGTILYGMNAIDTLRRLPQTFVSKESMDNFLGELGDSTQSNWTATYNENTGEYDYDTDLDLTQKANIDGYYEEMTVGAADNLTGKGTGVPAQFTRRTAGGDEDIADGIATMTSIKANTLIWNQLLYNADANMASNNNWYGIRCSKSAEDNVLTLTATEDSTNQILCRRTYNKKSIPNLSGHKVLVKFYYKGNITASGASYIRCNLMSADSASPWSETALGVNTFSAEPITSEWQEFSFIKTCNTYDIPDTGTTGANLILDIQLGCAKSWLTNINVGDTISLKKAMFIDLTAMFGAGNEPNTIAEFKSLFPLDFYSFNKGTFLNFTGESLKTVGFNQWDEEWELGNINLQTGAKEASSNYVRSKNYIRVFPNTTYYLKTGTACGDYCRVFFYDENYNYIVPTNTENGTAYSISVPGNTITSPANARYMLFKYYGTTYNNDACLNISWSGYRNGEYEPYWERTKDLPVSQYFSDGFHSTRAYYDEIQNNKYIQRVKQKKIDGSFDWDYLSGLNSDDTYFFEVKHSTPICEDGKTGYNWSENTLMSTFGKLYNTWDSNSNVEGICYHQDRRLQLRILKSRLTDGSVAALKTYLTSNPFYITYALENEIVTDLEEPLNLSYKVSDFGTEEILPENTSTPTTSPFNGSIAYGINATDTIRRLPETYMSEESMEAFLSALNTATNGTWTMTYNSETGKYGFTFTPNQN